jgi:hypothetical protein
LFLFSGKKEKVSDELVAELEHKDERTQVEELLLFCGKKE